MSIVDVSVLLGQTLDTRTYTIEGFGDLEIQGLSRAASVKVAAHDDPGKSEREILRQGIVKPEMDIKQISSWYKAASAGQIQGVIDAITSLSGMDRTDKDRYKSV